MNDHRLRPIGSLAKEMHLVICVFGNGVSRIAATTDLDNAFRQWRKRHGDFIPVAAFKSDPGAFCRLAEISRLPKTVSTEWAAEWLHRAPVELSAQAAVLRHIHWLGEKAPALLQEWGRAVIAAHN